MNFSYLDSSNNYYFNQFVIYSIIPSYDRRTLAPLTQLVQNQNIKNTREVPIHESFEHLVHSLVLTVNLFIKSMNLIKYDS